MRPPRYAKRFACSLLLPELTPRWQPCCDRWATRRVPSPNRSLGDSLVKQKIGLQGATFATNSGKRMLDAGDLDGAISQFRTAIKLAPGLAVAHYQLALALSRKGEKPEAAAELQRAKELDPKLTANP